MSAVADDVARGLEITGLGHDLLLEWGQWNRDDRDGRASWSAKPRVDPGHHGTPPERVEFVDKLIARHRLNYHDHWRVIAQYYLDDRETWEISRRMGRAWPERRVRTVLLAMCGLVEREYRDSSF